MVKFVLVGEMHGTQESPSIALELLKNHKITLLALELDKSKQHEIDEYFCGKRNLNDITLFKHTGSHDGRASNAVKRLIEQVKKQKIRIVLVDDWQDPLNRDKKMAENLMSLKKNVLFLCGNVHASKQPIRFSLVYRLLNKIFALIRVPHIQLPFDGILRTCGYYLPPNDTISYRIVPVFGGQYYNFKVKTLKPDKKVAQLVQGQQLPRIITNQTKEYTFLYAINHLSPSS